MTPLDTDDTIPGHLPDPEASEPSAASGKTPRLSPGDRIAGTYVIERFIAGGGMGQVFRARDERLDRSVALKLLRPDSTGAVSIARFEREARALSRVVHPNVVATYAFGIHEDSHYLVMEFVDGPTLDNLLSDRGSLPLEDVVAMIRQVGAGLSEAHALGIVHRDVKPGNILFRRLRSGDMMAKVVDSAWPAAWKTRISARSPPLRRSSDRPPT